MRIFGGARGPRGDYRPKQEGVDGLKKSEIIADLFNNQAEKEEDRSPVRVHLSHTSRALMADLKNSIDGLFEESPGLSAAVSAIELPDEDWMVNPGKTNLTLRKLGSYLRWLQMQPSQDEPLEEEAPFRAVHEEGQDEAILDLYRENLKKQEELRALKGRSAPNYYYHVYPETYSFN